jgi:hypothetical protein
MASNIARIHSDAAADFARRLEEKREQVARDANTAKTGFTMGMAEMVDMLQREVLRLNGILHDATQLPDRHAVSVAVSTAFRPNGVPRNTLFAVGSDKSMWIRDFGIGAEAQYDRWARVPNLPQAADEADGEPVG